MFSKVLFYEYTDFPTFLPTIKKGEIPTIGRGTYRLLAGGHTDYWPGTYRLLAGDLPTILGSPGSIRLFTGEVSDCSAPTIFNYFLDSI